MTTSSDPQADIIQPEDPVRDSVLLVTRRMEEKLDSVRLILFGLFVVETLSSLCLLFIIIYSIYLNTHQSH